MASGPKPQAPTPAATPKLCANTIGELLDEIELRLRQNIDLILVIEQHIGENLQERANASGEKAFQRLSEHLFSLTALVTRDLQATLVFSEENYYHLCAEA